MTVKMVTLTRDQQEAARLAKRAQRERERRAEVKRKQQIEARKGRYRIEYLGARGQQVTFATRATLDSAIDHMMRHAQEHDGWRVVDAETGVVLKKGAR